MTSRFYGKVFWFVVLVSGAFALASTFAFGSVFGPVAVAARAAETTATKSQGATSTTVGAAANKSSTKEADINASVEPPTEGFEQKQPQALLTVRLSVPQMLKRTDVFAINPYSTAPPKVAIQVMDLPESREGLKQKVMNAGYNNRLSMSKPYAEGGWRWRYAYQNALHKSGITEPHMFFQVGSFADDLLPYVIPEVKRINKIEGKRMKTYFARVTEFADNHKDEEMEALRLGLEPVKLNLTPIKKGNALETSLYISPGDWWITGSHKVPGLIYFWQEPIRVHEGDKLTVELSDANALLIQGGW